MGFRKIVCTKQEEISVKLQNPELVSKRVKEEEMNISSKEIGTSGSQRLTFTAGVKVVGSRGFLSHGQVPVWNSGACNCQELYRGPDMQSLWRLSGINCNACWNHWEAWKKF